MGDRIASTFRPKQRDADIYIWPVRGTQVSAIHLASHRNVAEAETPVVAVDDTTVYYSTGKGARAVEARDAKTGAILWNCMLLAENQPPTASIIDFIKVNGDDLLAQLSNCHNDLCDVMHVDARTGDVKRRIQSTTNAMWDIHQGALTEATSVEDLSDAMSGAAGYYYRLKQVGLRIWPDGSSKSKPPLHASGEFSNVVAGKMWVACVGLKQKRARQRDVNVYCWCKGEARLIRQCHMGVETLHSLTTFAPSIQLCTEGTSQEQVTPFGSTPSSCWVTIKELVSSLKSWACNRRRAEVGLQGVADPISTATDAQTGLGDANVSSETSFHCNPSADNAHLPIEQEVEHDEAPACIDPCEASAVVHEQWASSRVHTQTVTHFRPALEIVVLSLTKHSKTIEDVLLTSTLATSLKTQGVDVKPEWAGGAKIFVAEFQSQHVADLRVSFGQRLGLGPNHVVVAPQNEANILALLKTSSSCRALATSKPGATVREDLGGTDNYFACSSIASSSCDFDRHEIISHMDERPQSADISRKSADCREWGIIVKHTFIHTVLEDGVGRTVSKSHSDPDILRAKLMGYLD